MNLELEKLAKRNRNYYLRESEEGGERWFRCIKSFESYSEPILITPKMAKELLDTRVNNRPFIRMSLSEDAHHAVAVNFSGELIDGQNILCAIVDSNKKRVVFMCFNVPDVVAYSLDSGCHRKVN
jgi:hypothetical protein